MATKRFPWRDILVATVVYVVTYEGWRVFWTWVVPERYSDYYKILWLVIGDATPLIATTLWVLAATLAILPRAQASEAVSEG